MILLRWPRTWKLRSNPTLIRSLKKTLAFLSTSDMSCVNKGDQQKGRKLKKIRAKGGKRRRRNTWHQSGFVLVSFQKEIGGLSLKPGIWDLCTPSIMGHGAVICDIMR